MNVPSATFPILKKGLSVDQVNYLNIVLMLVSGALALAYPFAVFLFSYAVLGPLHYLTEISWLHDRKYFTKGKNDYLVLIMVGVFITLFSLGTFAAPGSVVLTVLYLSVVAAGVFAFTSSTRLRVAIMLCAAAFVPVISGSQLMMVVFGILLPTLIHVFLFTGMFILAGTIRQKSFSGAISLVVFIAIAAVLLLWHPAWSGHAPAGGYIRSSYGEVTGQGGQPGGFMAVNYHLLRLLVPNAFPTATAAVAGVNEFLYNHPIARSVMAFIAFAYTYHYLNWFSKTTVIRWHKVPVKRLAVIMTIWFASLALYATDYWMGVRWLYFISFLHVLLEFPLNHVTFVNIVSSLGPPRPKQAQHGHNPA